MLSLLVFLPMIGGLIGWFCVMTTQKTRLRLENAEQLITEQPLSRLQRLKMQWVSSCAAWIAFATMFIVLIITLSYWYEGLSTIYNEKEWLVEIDVVWISIFNIHFHLVLDGLSIVMIMLTILLTLLAIIYSQKEKNTNIGLYYLCILWAAAGTIGLFLAVDLFLFFIFWEMVAIPLYFLIALWGRRDSNAQLRFNGATKFLIFTQISSLLMLISIVSLVLVNWGLTNSWTFDSHLLNKAPISSYTEFLIMLGFFAAFAVRIPLVPFHGWFIDAHIESSTTGSMIISGLLTNTAIYGLLRFVVPMFPNASLTFTPIAIAISLCTLFYSALLAFNQNDIKRLIAYTHIALMGFLTTMVYIGNLLTYQGLVIQMIAISLSIVGLFILSGLLTERYMTRNIKQFIGLRDQVRYLPAFTIFFVLAILGIPGTANFVGSFMLFFGSYTQFGTVSIVLAAGLLLITIALLIRMQPVFYDLTTNSTANVAIIYRALTGRDLLLLIVLLVVLVAIGLYPQPFLDTTYPVISQVQQYLSNAQIALTNEGA